MNPIIEKVARALAREEAGNIGLDPGDISSHYAEDARAAIRATLEHYMENVSYEIVLEARKEMIKASIGVPYNTSMEFAIKAAFSQALAELDA